GGQGRRRHDRERGHLPRLRRDLAQHGDGLESTDWLRPGRGDREGVVQDRAPGARAGARDDQALARGDRPRARPAAPDRARPRSRRERRRLSLAPSAAPDLAAWTARLLEARAGLAGVAHRTPVATSSTLDARVAARVFLKCENL